MSSPFGDVSRRAVVALTVGVLCVLFVTFWMGARYGRKLGRLEMLRAHPSSYFFPEQILPPMDEQLAARGPQSEESAPPDFPPVAVSESESLRTEQAKVVPDKVEKPAVVPASTQKAAGFSVQILATHSKDQASSTLKRLTQKGFSAEWGPEAANRSTGTLYRIWVGSTEERAEADRLVARLREKGFGKGFVVNRERKEGDELGRSTQAKR